MKVDPMSIEPMKIEQLQSGSMDHLKSHDLRKLKQAAQAPGAQELRVFLAQQLWNRKQYKEISDLCPSLALNEMSELEAVLRLQCQLLFRQAFENEGSIKRLIPLAFSYAAFLLPEHMEILISSLKKLVQTSDKLNLKKYFEAHNRLWKQVHAAVQNTNSNKSPLLLLNPEILAQLMPKEKASLINAEVISILKKANSDEVIYYLTGGFYLLLAEGEYLAEIESRPRQLMSVELNLRIDLILAMKSKKKWKQAIRPLMRSIAASEPAQALLGDLIIAEMDEKDELDHKKADRAQQWTEFFNEFQELHRIHSSPLSLRMAKIIVGLENLKSVSDSKQLIMIKEFLTTIDDFEKVPNLNLLTDRWPLVSKNLKSKFVNLCIYNGKFEELKIFLPIQRDLTAQEQLNKILDQMLNDPFKLALSPAQANEIFAFFLQELKGKKENKLKISNIKKAIKELKFEDEVGCNCPNCRQRRKETQNA